MPCSVRLCGFRGQPGRDRAGFMSVSPVVKAARIIAGAFGIVNLTANTAFTSTATYSASCTGTANTTVRTCPNIDVGSGGSTSGSPRFLLNGASQLNFNLYQDGAHASVWGSNLWSFAGSYPSPTIDV